MAIKPIEVSFRFRILSETKFNEISKLRDKILKPAKFLAVARC